MKQGEKSRMELSVVIPIYGCKAALEELYHRLTNSLLEITQDYEIILVNDACPQNSWELIERICTLDPKVKGIELARNFGQMKAILSGLDYSTGDWVVVMDCDLQDSPEDIPKLYSKAQEGYDAVFAKRKNRKDSPMKVFLARAFYKIYDYATDGNYDGALSNFSVVKRSVIDYYCQMREQHRSYGIYLKWLGFKHAVVEVEHNERYEGKSSYSLKKRLNMAFDILTSQSDKILKFTVKLGLLMAFIAFITIIVLIINYFTDTISTGWTSLIATMFLIGGLIITVIGIVGIYVGNIFMQVKERPLYVVRQILNDKKGKEYEAKQE